LAGFVRLLFMTPIVEYPKVVSSSLPAFRSVFKSRPRLQNFGNYLTGLILSPNRTISYMNDAFYELIAIFFLSMSHLSSHGG
jgi:hypothetical protein